MPKVDTPTVAQVGGAHYQHSEGKCPHCGGTIQHWDWAGGMPGLAYAATKYVARHANKGGFEDLRKAISFIHKMMASFYPTEWAKFNETEPKG